MIRSIFQRFASSAAKREVLEVDVVIVGAGPAGLAAAYHLKQLKPTISVMVLEKGAYVGAHILSGAVIDPCGFKDLGLFLQLLESQLLTPVTKDQFWVLTERRKIAAPYIPKMMRNEGNYVASLSQLVSWMGEQVQALGVDIFPGFAASRLLVEREDDQDVVKGVATNDVGLLKTGEQGPNYQPGMEIRAPLTLLAEGCHGHLSKQVIER